MADRQHWYNIRLIKGKDRRKDISYAAQLDGVKKVFKACSIDSTVWTHVNRGSAAKLAEAAGASEAQLRRAGCWNGAKMEGSYLTTLPKKAMRALAGFGSKTGVYWLPRASIDPSAALQRLVFPEVEKWELFLSSTDTREIAGSAFLHLRARLRMGLQPCFCPVFLIIRCEGIQCFDRMRLLSTRMPFDVQLYKPMVIH